MPLRGCAAVACAPVTIASLSPLAALPSPSTAVWQLGPVPIRAYALCIIAGIVVACWVTERRLRQRGVAPGRGARHRRLGGARGHHRRPDLPRDHLAGEILRRRRRAAEGVRHLGGRSRHLGRGRRWRGRRLDRGPAARHPARRGGRRAGARAAAGPGDRPVRQLVQQRAVRRPDHPAVGPARSTGWTRTTPGTRCGTTPASRSCEPASTSRRSSTRRCGTSASPALVLVLDRRLQAGPGPGVRALRDGLHRRPVLDRADAHRRGEPDPRRPAQRLDRGPGLPRRVDLLPAGPRPAGVPDPDRRGGHPRRRRPTSDVSQVDLSDRRDRRARRPPRRATGWSARSSSTRTGTTGVRAAGAAPTTAPPTPPRPTTTGRRRRGRRRRRRRPAPTATGDGPADGAGDADATGPTPPARAPPTGTAERGRRDAQRGGGRRRGRRAGGRPARWPAPAGRSPCWSAPTGSAPNRPRWCSGPTASARCRPSASAPAWTPSPPRCPTAGSAARTGTGWCSPDPTPADRMPVVVHREDLHDALIAGLGDRVELRTGVDGAPASGPSRGERPARRRRPAHSSRPTWWSPPTARTA